MQQSTQLAASAPNASLRAVALRRHGTITAAGGSSRRQGSEERTLPRRLLLLLWRHAAIVGLSAPTLTLALPPPAAAALAPALEVGGSGPPSSSGSDGGSGGWGGGGGNDGQLQPRAPQEAFQLAAGSNKTIMLSLVSFAVTRRAYSRIIRVFANEYKEDTGRTVKFRLSFGGSGTQARAVIDGLPADIAALALPLDTIKIQDAGLIRPGWEGQFPNKSVVVESVVSIVVRKGNPKNIRGWDDLTRDDVDVIVANPKTAGVARWIFLALWGHRMAKGTKAATQYVTKVFDRVEVQPRDAREASDVFYKQGFGDALLTYENEAVFTNIVVPESERLPFFSPDNNVRIQCPVALIDHNLDSQPEEVRMAATDFVNFLYTPAAQREFLACGFRSPVKELARESNLPTVKGLWTVEDRLGSWKEVQARFFDDGGILSEIQRDVSSRKLQQRITRAKR